MVFAVKAGFHAPSLRRSSIVEAALANRILDETGVALTPGVDFGESGKHFLRISYANSMENIAEGMTRLEKFLAAYRSR